MEPGWGSASKVATGLFERCKTLAGVRDSVLFAQPQIVPLRAQDLPQTAPHLLGILLIEQLGEAQALVGLGFLAFRVEAQAGDRAAARALFQEASSLAAEIGDLYLEVEGAQELTRELFRRRDDRSLNLDSSV